MQFGKGKKEEEKRPLFKTCLLISLPSISHDDDAWASSSVLSLVCPQGEVLYRVRWKNYCSDDDTWEPEAHLEDCREVLLAFKKSCAEAKAKKEAETKKSVVSLNDKWQVMF